MPGFVQFGNMKHQICLILTVCTLAGCDQASVDTSRSVCSANLADIGAFIEVPAGQFIKAKAPLYPEEGRSVRLNVGGFLIQTHEVTNAQFFEFVQRTGYITDAEREIGPDNPYPGSAVFSLDAGSSGGWELVAGATWRSPEGNGSSIDHRLDHPVVHVSLADAKAYADWAGGRLPSEIEWEYAASLGLQDSENQISSAYSDRGEPIANTWQGIFPIVNEAIDGFEGTSPVGCFISDKIGLSDMIGNVWEWTDTQYGAGTHTIKGGSFLCSDNFCRRFRPAARQPQETDFSSNHIGFRIVKDSPGQTP